MYRLCTLIIVFASFTCVMLSAGEELDEPTAETPNYRVPTDDADLRYWLSNMIWFHHFSTDEIQSATGLTRDEIEGASKRFDVRPHNRPRRRSDEALLVVPYPGGRHPRIGFLDGAVRPQRETKISIFTPWDDTSYIVADVPEAIWSNLGLTYLAHTHVPTIWTDAHVELAPLEWNRHPDGTLDVRRRLPNGIEFGTKVKPDVTAVRFEMWLTNRTGETLMDLRVQNCVMLKGARGFAEQTNDNKRFQPPYAACRSRDGQRWIIVAWEPCQRAWGNAKCPCLHSDPQFPDCPVGETRKVFGWLSFFEGENIEAELARIDKIDWRRGN